MAHDIFLIFFINSTNYMYGPIPLKVTLPTEIFLIWK